jgi:hypothetical protein
MLIFSELKIFSGWGEKVRMQERLFLSAASFANNDRIFL